LLFSQRNGDVVVLDNTGLGEVDALLEGDLGKFTASVNLVVPAAEVEHVALGAISQATASGTGSELGVKAFGLELVHVFG
jgi:hypothetical protein